MSEQNDPLPSPEPITQFSAAATPAEVAQLWDDPWHRQFAGKVGETLTKVMKIRIRYIVAGAALVAASVGIVQHYSGIEPSAPVDIPIAPPTTLDPCVKEVIPMPDEDVSALIARMKECQLERQLPDLPGRELPTPPRN